MTDENPLLNVAEVRPLSYVNGPGARAVVWVQGCTLGCPGCFNPHTHPHAARRVVDPARLARDLAAIEGVEGLTISGGEPFEQPAACAVLAETARAQGLTVMVYTGWPLRVLKAMESDDVGRLLAATDLLVAGPYVAARDQPPGTWLASANQQLHHLTERLLAQVEAERAEEGAADLELVTDGRRLTWSGFPTRQDLEALDGDAA